MPYKLREFCAYDVVRFNMTDEEKDDAKLDRNEEEMVVASTYDYLEAIQMIAKRNLQELEEKERKLAPVTGANSK